MSWDAYRSAVVGMKVFGEDVIVGPLEVVGETSVEFPSSAGSTVHIVTAHNPNGVAQSDEANREAYHSLLDALQDRGLTTWAAVGGDPERTHTEASAAIVGLSDQEAVQLGRDLGQQAIFAWRPDSWDLINCADGTIERQPWGGVVTSQRLDSVDSLVKRWQLEPEWFVRTESGFSHWWHQLEQAVSCQSGSDGFDDWSATTWVVHSVADSASARSVCRALNAITAGFVYVFDEADREISVVASFVGRPGWDQPYVEWNQAALASYWHADVLANAIAGEVGGEVAVSGPPTSDLPRDTRDSMLDYQQYLRARPEWIWGGITATIPPLSELSGTLRQWLPSTIAIEDRSDQSGLLLVCTDTQRTAASRHSAEVSGRMEIGRRYLLGAQVVERGPFGPGVLAWLQWQLPTIPGGDLDAFVNDLNFANVERGTGNGAFRAVGDGLVYEIFVPAAALESMTQAASAPTVAQAASTVLAHLGVVVPYIDDIGSYTDASQSGWTELNADTTAFLRVFDNPALEALRGVPNPSPNRADRRLLWAPDTTGLCHFGIFNPMGPTLNSLVLARDENGEHHILHLMRHPFSPEHAVLGRIDTDEDLGGVIRQALPERLFALPDFVWIAAPDELRSSVVRAMWDVFASLTASETNVDTDLAWQAATLRQYDGRAWDRLNHVDDVPEPDRPYVGLAGLEYQLPVGPSRDLEDWMYAAADENNVWGTLFAFPSAWDGSINFQREHGNLGQFDMD